jgi:hypothetical protein
MDIQLIEEGTHIAEKAHRFRTTLAAVNARIVLLAHLVGASLDTEGKIQQILDRSNPAFRQKAGQHTTMHSGHASRAAGRAWEELRGLIVLRCDLVKNALEVLGLGLTYEITSQVEQALARKGIRPGADGFDLYLQMDRIVGASIN